MENTSNCGLKRWDGEDRILHTEFKDWIIPRNRFNFSLCDVQCKQDILLSPAPSWVPLSIDVHVVFRFR